LQAEAQQIGLSFFN